MLRPFPLLAMLVAGTGFAVEKPWRVCEGLTLHLDD